MEREARCKLLPEPPSVSKSMEQEAAKIMWQRSVEKFSFRYVEMLSDGDSVAYKAVCDIAP